MKKIIIILFAAVILYSMTAQAGYLDDYPNLTLGCGCNVGHRCYSSNDYVFTNFECIKEFCGPCDSTCPTFKPETGACWSCGECGTVDGDVDGYYGSLNSTIWGNLSAIGCKGVDCDDSDTNVNPGAREKCDGIDNNCNGLIDDGVDRYSWDGTQASCCLIESQCLVDVNGNGTRLEEYLSGNPPKCTASGTYLLDHLCIEGNWFSRTNLIASHLLNLTVMLNEKNFTIHCGSYDEALNNYASITEEIGINPFEGGCSIAGKGVPCMNDVCVLKINNGNKVIIGTSTNIDFSNNTDFLTQNILGKIFGYKETDCDDALKNAANIFKSCNNEDKLWINRPLQLFIYSDKAFTLSNDINSVKTVNRTFNRLIKRYIISVYNTAFSGVDELVKNINPNKLYILVQESRKTFSFRQLGVERSGHKNEVLAVQYSNFLTDLCPVVDNVSQGSCSVENTTNTQIVSGERLAGDPGQLFDIWPDLTAKIRAEGNVTSCIGEGDSVNISNYEGCCFGLMTIPQCGEPDASGNCSCSPSIKMCTDCGNGICEKNRGENNCNCAEDCKPCTAQGNVIVEGSECCGEGVLTPINYSSEQDAFGRCWYTTDLKICSPCGDGVCNQPIENECNCPQDCLCLGYATQIPVVYFNSTNPRYKCCGLASVGRNAWCRNCTPMDCSTNNTDGSCNQCNNQFVAPCAPCGDGWCSPIRGNENKCNCPQDCLNDTIIPMGGFYPWEDPTKHCVTGTAPKQFVYVNSSIGACSDRLGWAVCINCGDDRCDDGVTKYNGNVSQNYHENKCNCPQDCGS